MTDLPILRDLGLIQKLPYIRDLGVGAIWLLPIYPSPLRDDGYDISDYRGIHPDLGTLDDFRDLLDAAHGYGLRVLVDLVLSQVVPAAYGAGHQSSRGHGASDLPRCLAAEAVRGTHGLRRISAPSGKTRILPHDGMHPAHSDVGQA